MGNLEQEVAPAALYDHCVKTYNALITGAKTKLIEDGETSTTIVVWEGMLTALITQKLYFSTPAYTSITRALKRMGCIRQLKRGGGTAPSEWELIKEPTIEAFLHDLAPKVIEQNKYALQQTQITSINARLMTVEALLRNLFDEELKKSTTSELED